ncbi:hypothetical protein LSH36_418g01000 [Paralvinella palmiformis]|uniref:Enoyl-CoA hydratase n=1 Tax=Paralvinella palmiformis TaxID=53620 RepID=A0AAD9JCS0_9ANNE|nr:hypothetical protein LSH36_418g01000 [Paralvinella palmiformis]
MHSTDKEDYFRVRFDNDVAIITMCRDENRINGTFVEKINSVLDNILDNPTVKAVVTTGTGRFYSNGLDLQWLNGLGIEEKKRSKLSSGQTCHEVIVLGRRYTAEEALNAGIVQEISAPVELMSKALSWINNNLPKYGYDRKHLQTIKEDIYNDEFQTLMAKL